MSDLERKILTISGVKVMFPCKPYPSQFSMMDRVIKGLERKQNCLLESPTGSGKSLALLCSALAWQCTLEEKLMKENLQATDDTCCKQCTCGASESTKTKEYSPESKPKPMQADEEVDMPIEVSDDDDDLDFKPLGKYRTPKTGQGPGKKRGHIQIEYETDKVTIPEEETKCMCNKEDQGIKKRPKLPKIFFGTRTHKQIAQIIRELGKTEYSDVRMAILGSREHTCIHPEVSRMKNKSDGCRERLDGPGCTFNDRAKRVFVSQHHLQDALPTAWDLEDLISACRPKKACPYFVTRNVVEQAHIVFCPYNYLIDPLVRLSMEMNLKDQIVILDEAHNIEDSARDAASGSLTTEQLNMAIQDLKGMVDHNVKIADHLAWKNMLERIVNFMEENESNLEQLDYDTTYKLWSGFDIVARLKNLGLGPDQFADFKQRLNRIAASDENQQETRNRFNQEVKLHTPTLNLLIQLVQILDYMYRNDMQFVEDYRVAVMKSMQFVAKRDTNNVWMNKNRRGGSKVVVFTLNFWCMNPAVAFSDFTCCRNIVLSSGTLSPMSTFSSELGVEFPIQLEANHVIEDKQVWVGALGSGPTGTQLQAVYKSKETYAFQDELGSLIHRICMTVPYGVLCFLPSYRDVQKFVERWKLTGMWSKIASRKRIMVEPRAVDKEQFDNMMKAFYEVVKGDPSNDFLAADEHDMDDSDIDGALFIAVCRGKVSEGMDFADNNARAVITVGIPFPSIKDLQVTLKKAYNDKHRAERGLLSGMEWYEIQAFRALNQALGRCIRHRKDWGALIMVDDRFVKNPGKYTKSLSKWVRSKVRAYEYFSDVERSLTTFTEKMKKEMPVISPDTSFIPCTPCTPGTSRRHSVYRTQSADTPTHDRSLTEHNQSIYFSPKENLGKKMLSPPSKPPPPSKTTPPTKIVFNAPVGPLNIQQQLMQIINSDTVPKDQPMYIVFNQGQPDEQTFLIEPNKPGKSAQTSAPSSESTRAEGNKLSPGPTLPRNVISPGPAVPGNIVNPGPMVLGNMLSPGPTATNHLPYPSQTVPISSQFEQSQLLLVNSQVGPLLVPTGGPAIASQQVILNGIKPAVASPIPGHTPNKTMSCVPSLLLKGENAKNLANPTINGHISQSVQRKSSNKFVHDIPHNMSSKDNSEKLAETGVTALPDQKQLADILGLPSTPKDKPYYMVLNKGTSKEVTLLVEPKKEDLARTKTSAATTEQKMSTSEESKETIIKTEPNQNKFLKFCQLPKTHSLNVPVATVTPQKADMMKEEPTSESPTTRLERNEMCVPSSTSPVLFGEEEEDRKETELKDKSDTGGVNSNTSAEMKKRPLFRKTLLKSHDITTENTSTKTNEEDTTETNKDMESLKHDNIQTVVSKSYGTRSSTRGYTKESIVSKLKRFRRTSTGNSDVEKSVLKEVSSPVTRVVENNDVSREDSDEEFLNTRRKAGRKRQSKEQHRAGQKRAKGVVYEGEEDMTKENQENSLCCAICGTTWSKETVYDKKKKHPKFLTGVSEQTKEILCIDAMETKTNQLQTLSVDCQGIQMNCYVDVASGCCVQYLHCKQCGKNSQPVGARVVMAHSSSQYKTGQTWILASAVKK